MRYVAAVLALGTVALVNAQSPADLSFDVISIKENTSSERGSASIDLSASQFQSRAPVRGNVTLRGMVLCNLIARAYEISGGLQKYGLFNGLAGGGPCALGQSGYTGVLARRFDIVAEPPAGSRPADIFAMLRSMLAQRFKLKIHREMRPLPVYALTVSKPGRFGPGLRPSDLDCLARFQSPDPPPIAEGACLSQMNNIERHINSGGRVAVLVSTIQNATDRFVVDTTGLSGTYEWHFSYAVTPDHPSLSRIYTAVREQLGLQLEPRTMPVEVLVIDHIERPADD